MKRRHFFFNTVSSLLAGALLPSLPSIKEAHLRLLEVFPGIFGVDRGEISETIVCHFPWRMGEAEFMAHQRKMCNLPHVQTLLTELKADGSLLESHIDVSDEKVAWTYRFRDSKSYLRWFYATETPVTHSHASYMDGIFRYTRDAHFVKAPGKRATIVG